MATLQNPNRDQFQASRLTQEIGRATATAFGGGVIGRVLYVLVEIVLARGLGTADFGKYLVGLSVMSTIRLISFGGLMRSVLRFGAILHYQGARDEAVTLFRFLRRIAVAFGVAAAAAIGGAAPWIAAHVFARPDLSPVLMGMALGLPLIEFTNQYTGVARAIGRVRLYVLVQELVVPATNLAVIVALLALGFGLRGAVVGWVAAFAVGSVVAWRGVDRAAPWLASPGTPLKTDGITPSAILGFAVSSFAVSALARLTLQANRLLLAALRSVDEVGIFGVAMAVALQITVLVDALFVAYGPVVSRLSKQQDFRGLCAIYRAATRWMLAGALPLFMVFWVFGREILQLLYGSRYLDAVPLLRILLVGQLLVTLGGPSGLTLLMAGRQNVRLAIESCTAALHVGLCLLLIPRLGALGVAVATSVSFALTEVGRILCLWRLLRVTPFDRTMFRLLGAIVAGSLFLPLGILSRPLWPIAVALFVAAYVTVLWRWILPSDDRAVVQGFLARFVMVGRMVVRGEEV